jgi:hypothetical protein
MNKKRVKIEFTVRNEGESAKTTSVILQNEYEIDEGGNWECEALKDFWATPIFNTGYARKVEIREIVPL